MTSPNTTQGQIEHEEQATGTPDSSWNGGPCPACDLSAPFRDFILVPREKDKTPVGYRYEHEDGSTHDIGSIAGVEKVTFHPSPVASEE